MLSYVAQEPSKKIEAIDVVNALEEFDLVAEEGAITVISFMPSLTTTTAATSTTCLVRTYSL